MFQPAGHVHRCDPVSARREGQWLLSGHGPIEKQRRMGLGVGLRRALFDGKTPASLGSLALWTMASTGAKNSHM